jgi:head-tail adaptor
MLAGLLNEPITIIESALTTNDYGEEEQEWVEKYTTRARLVHDYGSRSQTNSEIFYTSTKTFQVRYYVPVTVFDRIIWNSLTYRIIDIEPSKEMMNLTIKAELVNE